MSIFESHQNGVFSKGLVHHFGKKIPIFSKFVFLPNKPCKSFSNVVDLIQLFLCLKSVPFRKLTKSGFLKGVDHPFGQILTFFPNLLFDNISLKKSFSNVLDIKQLLLGHKNVSFLKMLTKGFQSKIGHFSFFVCF